MGTLKRIGTASQTGPTGGRLRRLDTGETITYNPDPVRSRPNVAKTAGVTSIAGLKALRDSGAVGNGQLAMDNGGAFDVLPGIRQAADTYADSTLGRVNMLNNTIRSVQREREQAEALESTGFTPLGIARVTGRTPERTASAAELSRRAEELTARRDQLLREYYTEDNENQLARLGRDSASRALYDRAAELTADEDDLFRLLSGNELSGDPDAMQARLDELEAKYGSDDWGAVYDRVVKEYSGIRAQLEEAGYDFDRIHGYEQSRTDAQTAAERQAENVAYAHEHPVRASVQSVLASPLQGAEYLETMLRGIGTSDVNDPRSYVPMNTYRMTATNLVNDIRSTVAADLEENTDWEVFGVNVASFLYQTGMSVADSAALVSTLGPYSVLVMGGSAAASQAKNVIDSGGTNAQAFWSGLAAGAAEVLFEKFSVDSLLSQKDVKGIRDLLAATARQAGVEASEETFTELANILSEAVILRGSSDYAKAVREYQAQGLTYDAARRQAMLDNVSRVVQAGVGGALSGGAMTQLYSLPRVGANYVYDSQTGKRIAMDEQQYALVQTALQQYGPDSETHRLAVRLQNELDKGGETTISQAQLGRLARLMQEEYRSAGPQSAQGRQETAQTLHPEAEVISPTVTAFQAAGETTQNAVRKAQVLDRLLEGDTSVTDTELRRLGLRDQITQRVFTQLTGIEVPQTTDTRTLLDTYRSAAEAVQDTRAKQEALGRAAQEQLDTLEGAQATIDNGPSAIDNGQWTVDNGSTEQTGRVDIGDIFKPADTGPGLVRDSYTATLERQLRQEVHDVAKLLGVQVRFVDQVDGGAANAAIRGNEVLIERNNPAPVRALLGHELTHRIQELAPEQYAAFREAALRELGNAREQAEGVQALYRQQGRTLSTEAALDEVAADYAGQLIEDQDLLKRFIRNNQQDRSLLQRLLDAVRSLAEKLTGRWKARAKSAQTLLEQAVQAAAETVQTRTGQNKSAAREDGAERFSIKYDRDNNPYVVIEEDILDGVPRSEWVKTVKDNLRQKFPNGVTVGNNVININQQSRGEMTFSRYMQRLFNVEPQMYADKLRATNNVDEILRAARNWVNEALLHPRRDDIIDFARGEVLIRIGNNDYIAQVIVGNRGARGLLLYDIINLAETEIRERTKKADAVYTANAQNGPRSRGPASAESSVPQTGDEVKTQFSLKDTDSEGQPLTQEQQEFFRDSKVVDEDGQLLVVYHGTDAEFTIFDRTMGRANMDIQGSFFSPWEDDARGYGGTVEAYYLNLTNPADEGTAYQALRRFQGQNGAGAKARDYLIRQGYDGVNNSGEEYIAFYPEQIKRVDNAAPTADPDIRFSLKGSREMQQAVKELMERTDREAGWTEAEFRREVDQIARRIYGAQVAETKARAEAQAKRARTQRSATQLRRQITRHAGELSQKLRKPTDNRHVPEELRRTAAALLDAINLESAYNVDPETGKRTKNGGGDPVKRTEAFRALKEQYQAIVNDEASEFVVDPNLFGSDAEGIQGNFDKVLKWKDVRLADMNLEQLETVWQVIRAVEKSITTAGKTLTAAKYESTKQWADALAADTATRKDKGSLTRSHASLDLETPLTFFSHYGNAGNQIYRMLRDAQDKQAVLLDQVARAVEQLADRKQVRAWEKETHTFQVEGGELTLTTAQLMDLYELSKRKQAQDHLYRGGIVQPEVRSARIRAGTDGVRVTPGDVADMLSVLTDEQRQAADGLQQLMSGLLADMGNEATLAAYGYRKFTEGDYWPITVARSGIRQEVENGGTNARSIKNIGLAKSTVPNAANAVTLGSVADVFSRHAADMTDYAAWLLPMEDASRLFNYAFRDGKGRKTGRTVKAILNDKGGPRAEQYWLNLMRDIQNGTGGEADSALVSQVERMAGRAKGAAVGGNLRVVVQQPTAYLRAATVLSPASLAKGAAGGVTKGKGWQKALEYAPIAKRKLWGGFEITNSAQQTAELLFHKQSGLDRFNEWFTTPAAWADAVTWGRLWNACEWQVAQREGKPKGGTADFYRKVSELFTRVIDETQVVDGVLQRSQIMRSSSGLARQLTAFMGEPTMSLNLFLRAWDQYQRETEPTKKQRALGGVARAASALLVTGLVNALAQSLVDALRDDDEDKDYGERFWAAFTGLDGEEESAWDKAVAVLLSGNAVGNLNPLGMLPVGKDLLSLLQGYSVERMDVSAMGDFIQAVQLLLSDKRTPAYTVKQLASTGAKLFGVSAGNILRDVWGVVHSAAVETGNIPLQYELTQATYRLTSESNRGRYMDLLFRALEQGDTDSYQRIAADLIQSGTATAAYIDSAMRSRYASEVKRDSGFTLPQEALDLIGSGEQLASAPREETFGAEDLDAAGYQSYTEQRAEDYRALADVMGEDAPSGALELAYDYADELALRDVSGGQYEDVPEWMASLDREARSTAETAAYLALRARSRTEDATVSELALTSGLADQTAATALLVETSFPDHFTDPSRSGYEYQMDEAQQERYRALYEDAFRAGFAELTGEDDYRAGGLAERKELLSQLKREVGEEVRKEMASWLREQGVKSKEKE